MTTKFTASNGLEIEITEDGYLRGNKHIHPGVLYAMARPDAVEALREFFQHERDQELGRWHDPDNPDFVVYRMPERDNDEGRAVRVLDETTGYGFNYCEHSSTDWTGKYAQMWETVERYFAAHPETKPWDEAESGDIWELTGADGLKQVWVRNGTEGWVSINALKVMYYDGKGVTAGRRIWPEED